MMCIKSLLVICFLCFTTVLSLEMNCLFRDYSFYAWKSVYSCKTQDFSVESANEAILNIIATHESVEILDSPETHDTNDTHLMHNNNNVKGLLIDDEKCNYFPANVNNFFPHLELLQVSNSKLNYIVKGNFNRLLELKFVRIINNNIFNVPENTFMGAENIKDLKIYSNHIRLIDENAFRGLVKLENLELSKNLLNVIELKTFKDLVSLKYLHLSENNIIELPSKLFDSNIKLEKLNIRSNKLTIVNVDMFIPLKLLQEANFDNNFCVDSDAPQDLSIEDLKKEIKENCTGARKKVIPLNMEENIGSNMKQLEEKVDNKLNEYKKQVQDALDDLKQQQTEIDTKLVELFKTQHKSKEGINLLHDKVSFNELLMNETLIRTKQEILKIKNKPTSNVWNFILIIIFVIFVAAFIVLLFIKMKSRIEMKNQNISMTEALID